MSQYTLLCLLTASLSTVTTLSAQPPQLARPEFEVASIRIAAPTSQTDHGAVTHGGPGTPDPGRILYRSFNLRELILRAYQIPTYRLIIPDSFAEKRFDVVANLNAGTTQEQLDLMLQNLLADRFGLRFHRRPTAFDTYKIVVAKGGAKLKPTTFTTEEIEKNVIRREPDGMFLMPGRLSGGPLNGTTTYALGGGNLGMSDLARDLEIYLRLPVADATGLPGKYDIKFTASMPQLGRPSIARAPQSPAGEVSEPAPDIFQALEKQLGLKMEKSRELLDVIVVDSAQSVPTEN